LVTVVILSAFVPTLIAQQFFRPNVVDVEEEEALGAEDISLIHHHRADDAERSGPTETSTVVGNSTVPPERTEPSR
jgi:hypothetical protein